MGSETMGLKTVGSLIRTAEAAEPVEPIKIYEIRY